jgi:hypothetical protein
MDLFLACLHGAAYAALAFAIPLPAVRRPAIAVLLLTAIACLATGLLAPSERTLVTVHTYAGFEGYAQEVSMVSFPTGTATAPGWQWPLPFLGFALLWSGILWRLGQNPVRNGLVLPLLFAWTATAMWLGTQFLAGPSAIVQPLGLDRVLYPAGIALALCAAYTAKSLPSLLIRISAGVVLARLPAAAFSKLASDSRLGTGLDIHTVRDIVNPLTGMQFDPRITLDSPYQQFWLIWLEHVIMFPAIYLLSLTGIAFGVYMFHKHSADAV